MVPERTCQRAGCGRPIPSVKRRDARWCSRSCESKARRAALRQAAFAFDSEAQRSSYEEAKRVASGHREFGDVPGDFELAAELDDDDWADRNEHFARLVQAGEHERTPRETWKRWRSYARRNPGVEHPEQTQDRLARHHAAEAARMARIDAGTAGRIQNRYDPRTATSVAASANASRRLNRVHAEPPVSSPAFDFRGESWNGGPFRQGRPAGQSRRRPDAWAMEDGFTW